MNGEIINYGGTETIMVIDDDDNLLKFYFNFFRDLGYKVITAKDGNEAVDTHRLYVDSVRAVLMDVVMPHKDGVKAYFEMKELNPNVFIALYSGNPYEFADRAPNLKIMQKPISPIEIAKTIREGIDAVSPA